MASFGQMVAETFIGALQGKKYQDDTESLIGTRNAVLRAIRPDLVFAAVVPGGAALALPGSVLASYAVDRDAASQATADSLESVLALAKGEVAKLQLQEILGTRLNADTPMTNRLFEQMGIIANLGATVSAIGIAAEVASLGQIDRCAEEVRRYLDYSGVTQLTNFGYGQILGEVLGEPLGQELRSVTGHTLLGLNDLVTLQFRRPSYNPDKPAWDADLLEQVHRYGLPDDKAIMLLQAFTFYPQVQDWIRFAVRDVFNAEAVAAGRYDDLFPADILQYSRKAGVSDQVVKWFWRAHWELPSPNMGYEMVHRGVITLEELDALLRLADFAPGWVDKMIAISYQPLTRVDARRMYLAGTIDRDRYLRAMTDLGYKPDDAELFVKWTDEELTTKTKDLSATQMQKAYGLGLVMESDYRAFLTAQGYDSGEVDTLMALDAATIKHKIQDQDVKLAQKRYKYKLTNEDDLKQELQKAGVLPEQLQRIVEETTTERRLNGKLPSKADLVDWLKKGLIDSGTCSTRIQALGFNQEDAELFVLAAQTSTSQTASE